MPNGSAATQSSVPAEIIVVLLAAAGAADFAAAAGEVVVAVGEVVGFLDGFEGLRVEGHLVEIESDGGIVIQSDRRGWLKQFGQQRRLPNARVAQRQQLEASVGSRFRRCGGEGRRR